MGIHSYFYFLFIHTRALFALNQSEAVFAELGEYLQNILSEAFWTPNIASSSSQFDEYPRTRFAKQMFVQLRTNYVGLGSTNTPN